MGMTTSYAVQERRIDGSWSTIKRYSGEAKALDVAKQFGESSPRQTFRVINPNKDGHPMTVVGMRCPAIQNDMHIR